MGNSLVAVVDVTDEVVVDDVVEVALEVVVVLVALVDVEEVVPKNGMPRQSVQKWLAGLTMEAFVIYHFSILHVLSREAITC